MQLEKIISLANKNSELQFRAMERSLRATGCDLPLWVIPYNDEKFELPPNASWWEIPEIINWINTNKLWPAFKKIQCLTTGNFQFVDSDIIFFRNPEEILKPFDGFITSCTHWNNPAHTYTPESIVFLKRKSTTWPKFIFNSGQWACNAKLYDVNELIDFCEHNYVDTLFRKNYDYKDQAGINLLVNYKNIKITNLTLPPVNMESTWAGDYLDEQSFRRFEENEKPYIIHWAGTPVEHNRFINQYLFKFLDQQQQNSILCRPRKKGKSVASLVKEKIRKTYYFIREF